MCSAYCFLNSTESVVERWADGMFCYWSYKLVMLFVQCARWMGDGRERSMERIGENSNENKKRCTESRFFSELEIHSDESRCCHVVSISFSLLLNVFCSLVSRPLGVLCRFAALTCTQWKSINIMIARLCRIHRIIWWFALHRDNYAKNTRINSFSCYIDSHHSSLSPLQREIHKINRPSSHTHTHAHDSCGFYWSARKHRSLRA